MSEQPKPQYSSPKCPVCQVESCATDRFPNCVGCGLDIFAEAERNRQQAAERIAARRSPAFLRRGNPYHRNRSVDIMSSAVYRIKRSLRGCRLRFALGLDLFDEEYCLNLFGFLIALPFLDRWHREPHEIMESWGFYYDHGNASFVICLGKKTKFIHMPWQYDHRNDKHMVQLEDGSWEPCRDRWEEGGQDNRFIQAFPYTYTLKDGTVQNVTATVYVDRREWRRKCLWYVPWFAKKRQSLNVEFSAEIGERTGSWKGGCIGCGTDMKKGETAEQALRRMERERVFD